MKVAGFSFIRNGIKFDYPFVEAIQSILPLCHEFILAVGDSNDETLKLAKSLDPKIRIIETIWDDSMRQGGRVLALETDKAFQAISADCDWCFYIQGDEVMHEQYLQAVNDAMLHWKDDKRVDGLLFKYLHFYGSYDYIGSSPRWYSNEIRVIKNDKSIYSFRDAQGFRKKPDQKLNVKPIDAYIYHYGWVKEPKAMQAKQENFHKLWHDDQWLENNLIKADEFDYSGIDELSLFNGTHPKVMYNRIFEKNWKFEHDISMNRVSLKSQLKKMVQKRIGLNLGYKNYRLI
jgi:hypothetical protein